MAGDEQTFRTVRFPLTDLQEQAEAFWQRWPAARADEDGMRFAVDGEVARLHLPLAGPRAVAGERIGDFCERLPGNEECQLVLLLRAGAMSFGCWQGAELVQHKAVRKYVVRGNGKAQQTHLKTRGKSRYGSRLRLQNWRSLLAETNERLRDCEGEFGPFDRILYAVPVRVFRELVDADPSPPFGVDEERVQRIPIHVHRPDHEELLRVRGLLERGRLDLGL